MKSFVWFVLGLFVLSGATVSHAEWQMRVHKGAGFVPFFVSEIDSLSFHDVEEPPSAPALALWLDASDIATVERGENDVVAAWRDKSSYGYDLALYAGTPTFYPDQQNGLPGILLKGESSVVDQLRGDETSICYNDSVTVIVAYRFDNDDNGQTVYSSSGNAIRLVGDGANIRARWNNAIDLTMGHGVDTEPRAFAFRRSGSEFKGWRADTGETQTMTQSTFADAITSFALSPAGCCSVGYRVWIFEIQVYNEPMEDAFIESVLDELVVKWGL